MRQIVYVSAAAPSFDETQLPDILTASRRNNPRDGVTGLLLYVDRGFLQVLEGPSDGVGNVYSRILRDPRHRAARVLVDHDVAERLFGEWSMGLERPSLDDQDLGAFILTQAAIANRVTLEQSAEIAILLRTFYRINKPGLAA